MSYNKCEHAPAQACHIERASQMIRVYSRHVATPSRAPFSNGLGSAAAGNAVSPSKNHPSCREYPQPRHTLSRETHILEGQGYKGLTIWAQHKTTLMGHFDHTAPCVVGLSCLWAHFAGQLLPLSIPASSPSLPQVLTPRVPLINMLPTKLCLTACFLDSLTCSKRVQK